MNVYVIQAGWYYEGFNIEGIYTDKDEAEKERQAVSKKGCFDFVEIHEYEVI